MRHRIACLLATGFMTAAAACAPAAPPDNRAQDEAALREADAAFAVAGGARDIDAVMGFHAPDAMVFPPEQPMVSGTEAIRNLWTTMSALPGFAVSWQAAGAVAARSGDIGYTWGMAQVTTNGPDGAPVTSESKYVTIWRKDEAGAWKVVADIFNSNAPMAPAGDMPPPPPPPTPVGSGS